MKTIVAAAILLAAPGLVLAQPAAAPEAASPPAPPEPPAEPPAPPAAPAPPEVVNLVCEGQGVTTESSHSSATAYGSGGTAYGSGTSYRAVRVPAMLRVRMEGVDIRIRPPASILPAIRGGDRDGWWPLTNVNITDQSIRGRFSINFLNKPDVYIDRMTGDITLRGISSFSGTCRKDETVGRQQF